MLRLPMRAFMGERARRDVTPPRDAHELERAPLMRHARAAFVLPPRYHMLPRMFRARDAATPPPLRTVAATVYAPCCWRYFYRFVFHRRYVYSIPCARYVDVILMKMPPLAAFRAATLMPFTAPPQLPPI